VRSFVLVRQVEVHVDSGHGLLLALILVAHGDRVANALHPDLVNIYVPVVLVVLYVLHGFPLLRQLQKNQLLIPHWTKSMNKEKIEYRRQQTEYRIKTQIESNHENSLNILKYWSIGVLE
jgi:hypothetical protein